MSSKKFWVAVTKTGFLFGFAGWAYIAGNAIFHPWTLGHQLTHFTQYPHEDTFGACCFVVSLVCYFAYNLIKDEPRK